MGKFNIYHITTSKPFSCDPCELAWNLLTNRVSDVNRIYVDDPEFEIMIQHYEAETEETYKDALTQLLALHPHHKPELNAIIPGKHYKEFLKRTGYDGSEVAGYLFSSSSSSIFYPLHLHLHKGGG